jgi:hypothetical protein
VSTRARHVKITLPTLRFASWGGDHEPATEHEEVRGDQEGAPAWERWEVECMGRMIHKAEADWKRSREFAASGPRPREQGGCHEQRYRGSRSSDLESGR